MISEDLFPSSLEELPVPVSVSRGLEMDSQMTEETSHLNLLSWLIDLNPVGWFGRTSPVSCHLTKEGILDASLEGWQKSGMGSPTGFLMLNTSEHNDFQGQSPNEEGVSSLSDIFETGEIQQKYYLTEKHCLGILHRAEQSEKDIPTRLKEALEETIQNIGERQVEK